MTLVINFRLHVINNDVIHCAQFEFSVTYLIICLGC